MKAHLLFENNDFILKQKMPENSTELIKDLELNILFKAMALNDEFLLNVTREVVLSGLSNDVNTIFYRQGILKDCLKNQGIVRDIYNIAVEAIGSRNKNWYGIFSKYPSSILYNSKETLRALTEVLKNLHNIATVHSDKFVSKGFISFFEMLIEELNDEYFAKVEYHLRELEFKDGVLISAELGKGNKGVNYVLRKLSVKRQCWIQRLFCKSSHEYNFNVSSRDESGIRSLSELRDEGINIVANVLAQSNDHILSFLNMLQTELAFYIGCLNLHEQLKQISCEFTFPSPVEYGQYKHDFKGLYDVCLALIMENKIVGNDLVDSDHKTLVIITGANQGGKTTFLRSIGVSQLMMQCGMFVPAEYYCSNICDSLFTHFKKEEDFTMSSGKLDEELSRMNEIVKNLSLNSLILFNESFAATNEREGSEIARQIVMALYNKRIKVFFITHLYDFANSIYNIMENKVIFLRAERQSDKTRTFKLMIGEPLQTVFGEDLYYKIFIKS